LNRARVPKTSGSCRRRNIKTDEIRNSRLLPDVSTENTVDALEDRLPASMPGKLRLRVSPAEIQ
jgi:hypothetical protein